MTAPSSSGTGTASGPAEEKQTPYNASSADVFMPIGAENGKIRGFRLQGPVLPGRDRRAAAVPVHRETVAPGRPRN